MGKINLINYILGGKKNKKHLNTSTPPKKKVHVKTYSCNVLDRLFHIVLGERKNAQFSLLYVERRRVHKRLKETSFSGIKKRERFPFQHQHGHTSHARFRTDTTCYMCLRASNWSAYLKSLLRSSVLSCDVTYHQLYVY